MLMDLLQDKWKAFISGWIFFDENGSVAVLEVVVAAEVEFGGWGCCVDEAKTPVTSCKDESRSAGVAGTGRCG